MQVKNGKYVYKNKNCMDKMHAFYEKALRSLNVEYKEKYVNTTYGKTHILIVGDASKPPIITLHGGNGISPLNIRLFLPLLNEYCIIAPDVIGMPGKSAPYRNLNSKKDDYGLWMREIMDLLGLAKAAFVVSSYSSAMMLSLAKIAPKRIEKAVLIVPSGIAHGPIAPMITKMIIPFTKYYFRPSKKGLKGIIEVMAGQSDELWYEFFDLMMSSYKMEMRAPKEYSREELSMFRAPVIIFASNSDIFFPANKVFKRAKQIFSGKVDTYIINGKHLPSDKTMKYVCDKSLGFLKGSTSGQ